MFPMVGPGKCLVVKVAEPFQMFPVGDVFVGGCGIFPNFGEPGTVAMILHDLLDLLGFFHFGERQDFGFIHLGKIALPEGEH